MEVESSSWGFTVSSPVFWLCLTLQIEEENAALLAALTDSLDGMVDAEVGGLSVFPALEEEPDQEEEEEDSLPLSAEDFSQSLGAETEDPSLVRTPLYSGHLFPSPLEVSAHISEHLPAFKNLISSPQISSCFFFVSGLRIKSLSQLKNCCLLKWSL